MRTRDCCMMNTVSYLWREVSGFLDKAQHCPALKISGRISIFMLTDDLLSMYDIKGKKIERRSLPGWRRARPESAACRAFFRRAEKGGY